MKQFNLSEKRTEVPTGDTIEGHLEWYYGYYEEDVKEFIRIFLSNCSEEQSASDNEVYSSGLEWAKIRLSTLVGEKLI